MIKDVGRVVAIAFTCLAAQCEPPESPDRRYRGHEGHVEFDLYAHPVGLMRLALEDTTGAQLLYGTTNASGGRPAMSDARKIELDFVDPTHPFSHYSAAQLDSIHGALLERCETDTVPSGSFSCTRRHGYELD